MFSRFTSLFTTDQIKKSLGIEASFKFEQRYNVAPNQMAHIVKNSTRGRHMVQAQWSLLPFADNYGTICDHTTGIPSKNSFEQYIFRHAITHQRCVVPVSGFYVWDQTDTRNKPYYITMADKSLLRLAGIWQNMNDDDGQFLSQFMLVTTESNPLISKMHEQMPLILAESDTDAWLDHNANTKEQLEHLYKPFPADQMEAYEVPTLIQNTRYDAETCIIRI
jgi:putative SOS response-associated peptidase YedK